MYPVFDSGDEAEINFARCRRDKFFILSDKGIQNEEPICVCCKTPIKDKPPKHPDLSPGHQGNRCVYSVENKTWHAMHYICWFENLMEKTFK